MEKGRKGFTISIIVYNLIQAKINYSILFYSIVWLKDHLEYIYIKQFIF